MTHWQRRILRDSSILERESTLVGGTLVSERVFGVTRSTEGKYSWSEKGVRNDESYDLSVHLFQEVLILGVLLSFYIKTSFGKSSLIYTCNML